MHGNETVSARVFASTRPTRAAACRRRCVLLVLLVIASSWASGPATADEWRLVNPLPVGEDLLGATHGNGTFVFVGREGILLTSPDGVSWEQRDAGTSRELHDVVWTGDAFVAVGAGGIVARSEDGLEWTSGNATSTRLVALAVGPNLVAVGPGGMIFTSQEGVAWSAADSGTDADLVDVVWTGSEYLVVGDRPELLTSPDGRSWTARDVGHDKPFRCIGSNGAVTVTVAEDGFVFATTDGISWTRGWASTGLIDVVWAGDRFIAAGNDWYDPPRHSFDGLVWSDAQMAAPGLQLDALASDGDISVGGGVGGVLAVTRDGGRHFKPVNTFTGLDLYGLAVQDGVWVAAAGTPEALYGALFTSGDGVNWEITYDMGLEAMYDIASDGSVFVAVGVINELWSGGAIFRTSPDGRTWSSSGSATGSGDWPWEWRAVAWDGHRFVAAGTGGAVATSSDATTWHLIGGAHVTDHAFHGVASDGASLVAVGETGVVAVSHDGQNMTVVRPGYEEVDLYDAEWGNGTFVAVGSGGAILTSADGDGWQEQSSGTTADLLGVRFFGEAFVAVGRDGVVLNSVDGVSWQSMGSTGGGRLYDVIPVEQGLTAVGENGLVVRLVSDSGSQPPVPRFSWRPVVPEAGTPVRFVDLSDGGPTSWSWDFGDGGSAEGPAVTHDFAEPGTWPVTLAVGNDHGVATGEGGVEVRAFCGAPPAAEISAPSSAASGETFEISWNETLAPGEVGTYEVHEATNPDFDDREGWSEGTRTSTDVSHRWSEGGSFYYRVLSRNSCPDGTYWSEPSATARVDIEPDLSDLGEQVRVIAAAAHGTGLKGTEWVTDVTIHNPGPYPAPAYLFLLPRVGQGDPAGSARHWVGPGESLLVADAVADLAPPGSGALLVASDRPLVVGSRTYNDGQDGTFGQFISGEPADGLPGEGGEARLIQLTQNADFRTNLALVNAGTEAAELTVSVFGSNGQLLGATSETIPGLSSAFRTDVLAGLGADEVDDAFAVISTDDEAAGWGALASVVDNRTGDPTAMPSLDERLRHRVVSRVDLPLIRDGDWRDVLFAGDVYVAVGSRGIAWSLDGLHWQDSEGVEESADFWSLGWNGSRILAVCRRDVYISDDGISWNAVSLPQGVTLDSVAWDGSRWVGVGGGGSDDSSVGFSPDGSSWEWFRVDDIRLRNIAWVGDRFIACGSSSLATSVDGLSWSVVDDIDERIRDFAWNGRTLVALGAQRIYTSTDFVTFSSHDVGREPGLVVWAGDRWVLSVGPSTIDPVNAFLVSRDASDWETVPNPGPWLNSVFGMTWDGDTVLAIDYRRRITWIVGDGSEVEIPAVAHIGGRGGSQWRSDVELHSPGAESVDCALEFVARGESGLVPSVVDVTVDAGASLRLPDVVARRFERRGAGSLTVRADGDVIVTSRTYAEDPTGSYGQVVPGLRATDAIHGFETGRLIQLRHSPHPKIGFRTNLGFVVRCPEEMEIDVRLYRDSGELLGTEAIALPPMGNVQLNDVFARLTDDELEDAYAVLTSPTPRCSFHAYASVVDNRTHDPVLVPAVPWPAER